MKWHPNLRSKTIMSSTGYSYYYFNSSTGEQGFASESYYPEPHSDSQDYYYSPGEEYDAGYQYNYWYHDGNYYEAWE